MRSQLFAKTTPANVYAFLMFCLAKGCAFAGVALGYVPAFWAAGACLLGLAALFLLGSVIICIREMNRQNREEEAAKKAEQEQRGLVQQMILDGTIFQEMRRAGYRVEKKNEMSNYISLN